jgi:hypothetical protein
MKKLILYITYNIITSGKVKEIVIYEIGKIIVYASLTGSYSAPWALKRYLI